MYTTKTKSTLPTGTKLSIESIPPYNIAGTKNQNENTNRKSK